MKSAFESIANPHLSSPVFTTRTKHGE